MAQVRKRHADVATGLHSKRTHAARHQAWHLTNRTLLPLAIDPTSRPNQIHIGQGSQRRRSVR